MERTIRIGVIGCGSVAMGAYLPLVQRLQLQRYPLELMYACDLDASKAAAAQERFGIKRTTTDFDEVLASEEVDLVLVLTAMQAHGKVARAALEAGKHVLVEKPMSMNLEEAAEIVRISESSKGLLVCAPHVILSETFQEMWRRVHGGDVGKVHLARAFYGWSGPFWGKWYYQPGGGPLFDLGVYNVTSLTGLLGPAKRVMAMSGIAIPSREVDGELIDVQTDDNFQILIDFGEATFAVVTTGFTIQRYKVPGIELYGTEGTIQMIGEDWNPQGYELWRNADGCWRVYEQRSLWHWTDGLRHLVECILEHRAPIIRPQHAYHVLEIMVRAMESGRDGTAKEIESSFEPPRFDLEHETVAAHLRHDPTREE